MSVIIAEELKAGVILGDNTNKEYIYMPGSEIGSETPMCIFEKDGQKEDLHLAEAVELAKIEIKKKINKFFLKRVFSDNIFNKKSNNTGKKA